MQAIDNFYVKPKIEMNKYNSAAVEVFQVFSIRSRTTNEIG